MTSKHTAEDFPGVLEPSGAGVATRPETGAAGLLSAASGVPTRKRVASGTFAASSASADNFHRSGGSVSALSIRSPGRHEAISLDPRPPSAVEI
jgi:hypothetical protein